MSQFIRNMLGRLSLESQQKVHNRVISTDHRVKLPRRKVGSDTSDTILTGASIEAARRAHGNISEEEVLEKLSRELRVQKRADETTTMSDIARRYEQAENTLIDAPPQEIAGVGLQEDRLGAFGEDQSGFQMAVAADKDYSGRRDDNTIRIREDTWDPRSDMLDVSVDPNKPTPAGLVEAFKTRDFGMGQDTVTPSTAGVVDAMDRLNAAAEAAGGFEKLPLSASGERAIDISDRLEDSVGYNRDLEGVVSRNLISAENARLGTPGGQEQAERNAWRANAEADLLGKSFLLGGPGAFADEQIGRIGEIRKLGTAKEPQSFQVINYNPVSNLPYAIPRSTQNPGYVDPNTGLTVGQQFGPYQPANVNQPTMGQALNAPSSAGLNSVDWTMQNLSGSAEGNQKNIGAFPQTNISGITSQVGALAKPYGWTRPDVRSVAELQDLVDTVNAEATRRGNKPVLFDRNMKKSVPNTRGTQEALNELKLTPVQGTALADALRQLELSQTGSADSYTTRSTRMPQSTGITFNAPEAISPREGAAPIAKVSRGRTVDNPSGGKTQISTAFKTLGDPEAAKPFIGAVGEEPALLRQFSSANPRYKGNAIDLRNSMERDWQTKTMKKPRKPAERSKHVAKIREYQQSSAEAESRYKQELARREREAAIMAPYRVNIGG